MKRPLPDDDDDDTSRRVLSSDDDVADSRDSVHDDSPLSDDDDADDDDDDDDPDTPPRRGPSKAKAPAKGRSTNAKTSQLRATRPKGTKDRDVLMKEERSREDDSTDASHIPKKRKLPPIKKTKTGLTPATTFSTQKPPPKPSLPASEQRKQALTGVRDIDLADSKVYAELFKGAGGSTPKSGLKNAEERRKELDRMRDEARARRADEGKFTFDLQSQADKIAHFEQRLRVENSTVLHPNFLAAKLRDEWEMERRNRRVTPKEEGEA